MEKLKCESFFGDYKCHVKTNLLDSNGQPVYVDKCLKETIEMLNARGFKTTASCCGHGYVQPSILIEGLSDKRKLCYNPKGGLLKKCTQNKCEKCKDYHY